MLRATLLILLLQFCINSSLTAQVSDSVLLEYELAFFNSESERERNAILLAKIDYHLNQSELSDQVFVEIERVKSKLLPREEQQRFYWNASLLYYVKAQHYRSIHFIDAYEKGADSSELNPSFKLLKFLTYAEYDTTLSNKLFDQLAQQDTLMNCLSCISDVASYELKHKKFRIVASYFIPGFGTMITGKPVKGFLSLSLNALSTLALIYTIQQQLWINTVGWGTNLIGKFYTGNIRLATKVIAEKEERKKKELAHQCELQIRSVLQRYPLNFRLGSTQ